MRVLIVGAGKIGCGYLTPLFTEAGHPVLLGCRTRQTADRVHQAGGWRVRFVGPGASESDVRGVTPVVGGSPAFTAAVASSDLIVTGVGVGNVESLADTLLPGLAARGGRPVDVWLVENADCALRLSGALERAAAAHGCSLPPLGVAGAVATGVIGRGSWDTGVSPEFVGDTYGTLAVDARPLTSPVPDIGGVCATDHYPDRLYEKLYGFSAGHALTAYLGWLRGHRNVAEAVADPFVRPLVAGALLEARQVTLQAFPNLLASASVDPDRDVHAPVAQILARFGNVELADPVIRVARDPLRKLGANDRLLGTVGLLRDQTADSPPALAHFALGVAAALLYGFGDDVLLAKDGQAHRLRTWLRQRGVSSILSSVCGLDPEDPFAEAVSERYHRFVFTDDGVRFPSASPHPVPFQGVPR